MEQYLIVYNICMYACMCIYNIYAAVLVYISTYLYIYIYIYIYIYTYKYGQVLDSRPCGSQRCTQISNVLRLCMHNDNMLVCVYVCVCVCVCVCTNIYIYTHIHTHAGDPGDRGPHAGAVTHLNVAVVQ